MGIGESNYSDDIISYRAEVINELHRHSGRYLQRKENNTREASSPRGTLDWRCCI